MLATENRQPYLEFVVLDDYLEHLRSKGITETYCELDSVSGKATDFGISLVTAYAIFTAWIDKDYIATCAVIVGQTDNLRLKQEREGHRPEEECILPKIRAYFYKVKEQVSEKGFTVHSGIWKYEQPEYLR